MRHPTQAIAGFVAAGFVAAGFVAAGVAAQVVDFDGLPSGSPVTQIGGVSFSENVVGYALAVVSRFDTTSGDRGLGVADGGFGVFLPGDVLSLDFDTPVDSLAIDFVSSPNTPGGAFAVSTTAGSASSGSTPDAVLADGGEVFHVSLSPGTPFSQAVISAGDGLYSFNLDDVVFAPEPGAEAGLVAGVALLLDLARRRHRRARSASRRTAP